MATYSFLRHTDWLAILMLPARKIGKKATLEIILFRLTDWLIVMACQLVQGYFMLRV